MQHFKDLKFINLRGQDKLPIIHGVVQKEDPESYTTWEGPSQRGPAHECHPKLTY